MTRKGAVLVINSMMIRLSEIEEAREKLAAEFVSWLEAGAVS